MVRRWLIHRPGEQPLAVAVAGDLRAGNAVEALQALAGQPTASDDACAGLRKLVSASNSGLSREQRQASLQAVVDNSKDDAMKKKAQDLLGQPD